MTPKQREQFNRMRLTLVRISTNYQTPYQIHKRAERQYGLSGAEALEYSYENIQAEAKAAVRGVRPIAPAEERAS